MILQGEEFWHFTIHYFFALAETVVACKWKVHYIAWFVFDRAVRQLYLRVLSQTTK